MVDDELRAQVLHDHYNNTFENIQKSIAKRERLLFALFLVIILMVFQMAFPADASQQIADVVAKKLEMQQPCNTAFIDSILWLAMLCLIIRYCQTHVHIERQYDYIHGLENKLNQVLGHDCITREGKAYLRKYPLFSVWTHCIYTIALPFLLAIILVSKLKCEFSLPSVALFKVGVDTAIFVGCLVSLVLYMVLVHLRR